LWSSVAIAVILAIIIYSLWKLKNRILSIFLGVIAGGILGNLIDRFINPPHLGKGFVIDFIAWGDLFIGNIADIFIVLGFIVLALFSFSKANR
jgi:signal peptidase II